MVSIGKDPSKQNVPGFNMSHFAAAAAAPNGQQPFADTASQALAFAVASMQNPGATAATMEALQASPEMALIAAALTASQSPVPAMPATIQHGFLDHQHTAATATPLPSITAGAAENTKSNNNSETEVRRVSTSELRSALGKKVATTKPNAEIGIDKSMETAKSPSVPSNSSKHSIEEEVMETEKELDDNERRLARSRERNREHARRTRLRKKAQLEALQSKVKTLEAERKVLKQKVEECGIASILLGLSSGSIEAGTGGNDDAAEAVTSSSSLANNSDMVAILSGSKRKRFLSEALGETAAASAAVNKDAPLGQQQQQRLVINIDGQVTEIGAGKSHMNWKTGVYRSPEGVQRQLTPQQLEDLRRERNRMHAKMTRSRKKCFIATIQKAIEELEAENQRMRDILEKTGGAAPAKEPPTSTVTPATSPQLSPQHAPGSFPRDEVDDDNYSQVAEPTFDEESSEQSSSSRGPLKKRKTIATHGFMLDG